MVKITKFKVMPAISRFFGIVIYFLEWSAQATPTFLSSAIATVGSSSKLHTDSFMRPAPPSSFFIGLTVQSLDSA
jgi:hypothetical protein